MALRFLIKSTRTRTPTRSPPFKPPPAPFHPIPFTPPHLLLTTRPIPSTPPHLFLTTRPIPSTPPHLLLTTQAFSSPGENSPVKVVVTKFIKKKKLKTMSPICSLGLTSSLFHQRSRWSFTPYWRACSVLLVKKALSCLWGSSISCFFIVIDNCFIFFHYYRL